MHNDFSKIFHQSSKDHNKGHPFVSPDPENWPDEWKTTYYKSYPWLPKVDLVDSTPSTDLFEAIENRKSRREGTKSPLTLKEISLLLKYSCGNVSPTEELEPGSGFHRAQPSGGARFPIEVYPLIFRPSHELKSGLYHYDGKSHRLDVLWEREFTDADIEKLFIYEWVKTSSVVFVMTSVFARTQNKYGERGYRYILLEAGHIGQNIYLVAEALGLKCSAIVGTWDVNLERLIDIDGVTESIVYAVALGK